MFLQKQLVLICITIISRILQFSLDNWNYLTIHWTVRQSLMLFIRTGLLGRIHFISADLPINRRFIFRKPSIFPHYNRTALFSPCCAIWKASQDWIYFFVYTFSNVSLSDCFIRHKFCHFINLKAKEKLWFWLVCRITISAYIAWFFMNWLLKQQDDLMP